MRKERAEGPGQEPAERNNISHFRVLSNTLSFDPPMKRTEMRAELLRLELRARVAYQLRTLRPLEIASLMAPKARCTAGPYFHHLLARMLPDNQQL